MWLIQAAVAFVLAAASVESTTARAHSFTDTSMQLPASFRKLCVRRCGEELALPVEPAYTGPADLGRPPYATQDMDLCLPCRDCQPRPVCVSEAHRKEPILEQHAWPSALLVGRDRRVLPGIQGDPGPITGDIDWVGGSLPPTTKHARQRSVTYRLSGALDLDMVMQIVHAFHVTGHA
jgi:hypothetical protein